MAENEKKLPVKEEKPKKEEPKKEELKEENLEQEELEEVDVITLIDEETGKEETFEFLAREEIDGVLYYALYPLEEDGDQYIVLKAHENGEDIMFESIDDDEEFYKVEEYFNDLLFNDIDYDKK